MNCRGCGNTMKAKTTDLPFKLSDKAIVIIKYLPVYECLSCNEFMIADNVMKKVDQILEKVDKSAELEIISYAA